MTERFDVIEVEIAKPHKVRVLATNKDERNAEAFINIAIARRGVETCFYKTCKVGEYHDGDCLNV